MKKKEVNINEESTSAGGAHAVNKFRISDFVMMAVIVILCASCVLPFLHVAVKSISGNTAVMSKSVYFWPKDITFDAYKKVFADNSMTYSMIFSVIVTVIFTALGMLVCTCAAYPLSKKRLKGKKLLTFLLMVPMYFSAGIIPSYLLYQKLHVLDTMWVLILPLIYSPYNMLIMKNYFQSTIPDSLEESAFLDGASNFQILSKIVLPLSKPILATLSLFYAVGRWNSYADNMYYTKSANLISVGSIRSRSTDFLPGRYRQCDPVHSRSITGSKYHVCNNSYHYYLSFPAEVLRTGYHDRSS